MVSRELVMALIEARRGLSDDIWGQIITRIAGFKTNPDHSSVHLATAGLFNRNAAWILSEAFRTNADSTWTEIAAAMTAVDCAVGHNSSMTEIIWTGPANGRFPVRRVDQVLYDLISKAERRIVLITFAAHRVDHLCEMLRRAVERVVDLTLIIESENESEGQLTADAIAAFKDIPPDRIRVYYWPNKKRERNQAGRPGKLHVKCAIVDHAVLIGSANLTDDAFNRNMELGLLIRDRATVAAIAEHFTELIHAKILTEVQPNHR